MQVLQQNVSQQWAHLIKSINESNLYMPTPSPVIQVITESDKTLIPEIHHYLAYIYVAKFVYTNTGLKSTTTRGNLR